MLIVERVQGGGEVHFGDRLTFLRGVHHRRVEHHVVGEDIVERLGVLGVHQPVPAFDGLLDHVGP